MRRPDRIRASPSSHSGRSLSGDCVPGRVRGGLAGRGIRQLGSVVEASRWADPGLQLVCGRHPRATRGPAHRAGVDGAALQERRTRRRQRDALLPRVFHGRFSLAHRPCLRAWEVHLTAAQPIPRAACDELLLDLFSAAVGCRLGRPCAAARRAGLSQDERLLQCGPDGGRAVPAGAHVSRLGRAGCRSRYARHPGGEHRRPVRRHRSPIARAATRWRDRHEHRRDYRLAIRRPPHRQHPAVAVVHAAAYDVARARPRGPARRLHRRRACEHGRDRRGGPGARPCHHDESAPRRGLFDHLWRGRGRRRAHRAGRLASFAPACGRRGACRPCGRVGGSEQGGRGSGLCASVRVCGIFAQPSRTHAPALGRSASHPGASGSLAESDLATFEHGQSGPRAWSIALVMLYLVRISEASWVGFRAGQLILVSLPLLLAPVLARLDISRRVALAAVIFVAGFPTTAIDTWNAQDIGNRRPGPGFRWTIWTTPEQQQAFAWIRRIPRDSDRADGTGRPRPRALDAHPLVRGAQDGRRPSDLAPAAAGSTRNARTG